MASAGARDYNGGQGDSGLGPGIDPLVEVRRPSPLNLNSGEYWRNNKLLYALIPSRVFHRCIHLNRESKSAQGRKCEGLIGLQAYKK